MSSLFCISIKDIFYTFHKLPIDRYRVDFHFYDISSFLSQSKKAFLHGRLLKQWRWKYHQPSTLTIISWKPRGWSQRCCCWWWLWWYPFIINHETPQRSDSSLMCLAAMIVTIWVPDCPKAHTAHLADDRPCRPRPAVAQDIIADFAKLMESLAQVF